VDRDVFDPKDVPQFAYTFTTPGAFVQDDVDVASWFCVSASARLDHYGRRRVIAASRRERPTVRAAPRRRA